MAGIAIAVLAAVLGNTPISHGLKTAPEYQPSAADLKLDQERLDALRTRTKVLKENCPVPGACKTMLRIMSNVENKVSFSITHNRNLTLATFRNMKHTAEFF